ncbi:MAG: T9SS type A sorting domain-containing protein [Bacteroidales bacterium]|nr:T9SS type A sorting domain-containing protein [Bacteroidales bacterium]
MTQASYGAEVTLPSRSAIGSYTFAGWSTTNVVSETTTAPTIIPAGSYSPTANITLYPVYTRTVGGGSQSKTESVTISDYATANNWGNTSSDGQKTITIDSNVTATCSDGTNSGKYYNDGWRLYESESAVVTIETTSGELTSVTFTFTNSNNGTLNYNSSSITSGTAVNVSGESAEFSVSRSSGNSWGQIRMTAISVNYTIPGTTYYNSGYFMSISKWTDEDTSDGWYLIAAPVGTTAAASISNLTSNSYDLFRFNQAVENEWENYNDDTYGHNHFALEPGRGYLYANSNDVTLTFFDQSTSNSNDVTLTYSGANTNPKMRGWNLIGNPFATTATIKDSDNNAKPFYRMNDTHTDLIPETTTGNVNPMEGIFVHTTTNNEVVTFTTKRATESNDNLVVIDLSAEKGNVIDRAIVRFDEGETLPKFQLKDNSTKLYIQQGGKDYAIAFAYRMGMLPLNFKAEKTGKYTLGFSGENMNGVKLIDKIANVTVDLGIENEYSFIGMPNDREDRFALVFSSASSETSHDVFAYQNGNEIVVNGEGILEVFDVTGRKVMITTINGVQTLNSLNTGFYIFRLNEKTQKIVVR